MEDSVTRVQTLNPETGELHDYHGTASAYLMWATLGLVGGHWFYLGKPGRGTLYLFTAGLFGIGWAVDFFGMPGYVRDFNTS